MLPPAAFRMNYGLAKGPPSCQVLARGGTSAISTMPPCSPTPMILTSASALHLATDGLGLYINPACYLVVVQGTM